MTEYEALVSEIRTLLQDTARDQDLVDGGNGQPIYIFTYEDAISMAEDWGASGDKSDNNIRTLFNNTVE